MPRRVDPALHDDARQLLLGIPLSPHHILRRAHETVTLMQELATLSDKINVVVHDFKDEGDKAEQLGVEQVPAIVVEGTKDYGVRYYGFPGGYEFPALLEDIIDVSKGESGLSEQSKERLSSLTTPVHLRVFSTPT